MTFVRNLWRDLVEKRLWPVAVVLLVALIAVPLAVGTGSSDPAGPAAAPATGATATPRTAAQVSLDTTTSTKAKDRSGAVRDPFKPLHVVQPTTSATTGTGAAPASSSAKTSATVTSKLPPTQTNSTTPTVPQTPSTTTPKLTNLEWVASIRLGRHAKMKTFSAVHGLTLLPSPDYVLLIFMGVKKDAKTAVFAVDSPTLVTGDGTCRPSPKNCELLELSIGDSALLTRRAGATHLKRYRVRVLSLKLRPMSSAAAKARTARAGGALDASTVAVRAG